jgi:thiamine-monophosphate kinase
VNLKELGEFGLIDRIAARAAQAPEIGIGIGDDAAALVPTPGHQTLVTSDMLVEGVHFDLAWTDPARLGRKSLSVNLSDIAAMGGRPRHALLSLAIPPALSLEFIDGFVDGFLGQAAAHDVHLVGGDTCASAAGFVISVTLMGEQLPQRIVRRSGARPGDLVFVTGTLGDSGLGLELLRRGARHGEEVERHLDPTPRVAAGLALAEAGLASAMIDVSDGLLADLGHILRLSRAGARIDLARIPLSDLYRRLLPAPPDDPWLLPLAGGEDYELLFTAPPAAAEAVHALLATCATPVARIGEITAGTGMRVVAADGSDYTPSSRGYNHFQ